MVLDEWPRGGALELLDDKPVKLIFFAELLDFLSARTHEVYPFCALRCGFHKVYYNISIPKSEPSAFSVNGFHLSAGRANKCYDAS